MISPNFRAPRHLASLDGAAGEAWCSDSGAGPARRMAVCGGPGMVRPCMPHFQTPGMGWVKRKGPPNKNLGWWILTKSQNRDFPCQVKTPLISISCGLLNNSTMTHLVDLWFCQVFNALTHQIHKISSARTRWVAFGTSRGLLAGAAGGGCEGGREGDFWSNYGSLGMTYNVGPPSYKYHKP
jgi:hypothetical protein